MGAELDLRDVACASEKARRELDDMEDELEFLRETESELHNALAMLLAYTRSCECLLNASESRQCERARKALAKARGEQEES